jgi:hypothetical protein
MAKIIINLLPYGRKFLSHLSVWVVGVMVCGLIGSYRSEIKLKGKDVLVLNYYAQRHQTHGGMEA